MSRSVTRLSPPIRVTGQASEQAVTDLHVNLDRELTSVTLGPVPGGVGAATGEGEGGRSTRGPTTLRTTRNHPFWNVATVRGFMPATWFPASQS
jgi:hypothetical protein